MSSPEHPDGHTVGSREVNVVLTGFMGTGKTVTGRILARKLGMDFVDTDELIEARHGAITDIFQHRGEKAFRDIERSVARELSERCGLVISTGGRMLLDPENASALGKSGRVFCLVAGPDQILRRVTDDSGRSDRPLLQVPDPRARIVELLAERESGYRRFPQVMTDGRSPESVAGELLSLLRWPPTGSPSAR
jgi:shikimate kinase